MDEHSQLLGRIQKALGPAAATMFAERGQDRRFIFELTVTGVALYLLGKYIDGFVEGLGIKDLGKQHGKTVAEAVDCAYETFTGNDQGDKKELEAHAQAVALIVVALRDHRSDPRGLANGSAKLLQVLELQGIPKVEAERITNDIVGAIWQP